MGDDEEICMHTIQAVRIEKESGFEILEEKNTILVYFIFSHLVLIKHPMYGY